ncbi:ATP-binding cassette domain-containing protein [Allofustis seminis]|uniref:ATP-binding cassette domain-containing protein n=1 Tax=Allofustis seminis TaxID=166939 RepID=UPI0003699C97|nr:ATP-binding cassette domain-containing protein [Allofustis seminis]
MIKLKDVTKKYGKKVVLDRVNLEFSNPYGIYGLLGRNGVGKTTMMTMIFNMITDYEGIIELNGQNVKNNDEALAQMVYVGGEINSMNFIFQGKINKLIQYYQLMYPTFDATFARKMLNDYKINENEAFKKLSTGNKTLVQNVMGLATRASISIFDEPTNGLDSVNRKKFFDFMMADYEKYPRMIVLSTHLIQEVENYLTDVIMLKDSTVLLDEMIEVIQEKAYRINNYYPENKNIIHQESLGNYNIYDIYDELSDDERQTINKAGGTIEHLDLQTLFNDLMEG